MDVIRSRKSALTRLGVLLVAGMVAMAACGGDDDDSAEPSATAGTTATTTAFRRDRCARDDDCRATDSVASTAVETGSTVGSSDAPSGEDVMIDGSALEGANRDGTLTVAWQLNLATMDPLRNANVQNVAYNFLAYDALIYRTPDGELAPGLATSWEWNDAGTAFTLKIRDGVTFQDGTTLDASVVKANLERLMAMKDSPVFGAVKNVASVDAPDASTVVINMTQADSTLAYSLADRAGMMASGKAIADGVDLGTTSVGAGPYKVVDFRAGDGITFERFDDYWGDPNAAAAKRVELVGIPDGQARANGVTTGEFDAAYITPSQVDQVKNAGVNLVAKSNLFYVQTYLNRSRPFFSDFRVSQAMSYAIDRDALCKAIYFGYCEPTFKPFPDDYWAGSPDIPDDYYTYDPEKAKQLLADAGLRRRVLVRADDPGRVGPVPAVRRAAAGAVGGDRDHRQHQPGRHQPARRHVLRPAAVRRPAGRRRAGAGAGAVVRWRLHVDVVRQRRWRDRAGHGRSGQPDVRRARPGRPGRARAAGDADRRRGRPQRDPDRPPGDLRRQRQRPELAAERCRQLPHHPGCGRHRVAPGRPPVSSQRGLADDAGRGDHPRSPRRRPAARRGGGPMLGRARSG